MIEEEKEEILCFTCLNWITEIKECKFGMLKGMAFICQSYLKIGGNNE